MKWLADRLRFLGAPSEGNSADPSMAASRSDYLLSEAGLRIAAIGDVHGRADLLQQVFASLDDLRSDFSNEFVEIYLGDYVDRGPSSREVLDRLGDAQKLPNQNRGPSCRPGSSSADSHGGREHDACFSSMPRSRRRLLRGLPWIEISQSPEGQNSLVAGKKAGNLFDSAVFCENPSRKHLLIQSFADEFPTRTEQGIFLPAQGIILASREWQGISAQS